MTRVTIPIEDLDSIIKAVLTEPLEDVAKRYGVIPASIRSYLTKYHMPLSTMQLIRTREEINSLLVQGLSRKAVRLKLGLSQSNVMNKYPMLIHHSRIPKDDLEDIVTKLQTKQLGIVADEYGVHSASLRRYIERHGYTYKKIVSEYRTKFIKQHLALGYEKHEIAKLLGITPNQLYTAFKNNVYTYKK